MTTSGCRWSRTARTVSFACLVVLVATTLAAATPPRQDRRPQSGGHSVGVRPLPPLNGPAGPTPFNPAGPTPLNPAGSPPVGGGVAYPRRFVPSYQPAPGMYVGVVGGGYAYGQGGSFYCQVHDRGYASQTLFLNHLADADGMYGEDALSFLIEDGGVWVFPAE
jgi:hypothetical protein